ncbi:MAG: hypothetical protein H0W20_09515 [Chthoniobacterales bacterium]|nr:hypothetical protein [Chthoniobacterales bacterium]
MHAISTLLAVSKLSGRLQPAGEYGEQLRAMLPRNCPTEVTAAIREHKPELLALLGREFVALRSDALNETVFFAADDQVRAELLSAGADESCIYTRDELRELVKQHRRAPLTVDELLRLHRAKRTFNGRIAHTPMNENEPSETRQKNENT